jgi:hypothetical protein
MTPQVDCIGAPPHPEGLEDVHRWRYEYARRLGFEEPEAALIAHRAEIDTLWVPKIRWACDSARAASVYRLSSLGRPLASRSFRRRRSCVRRR